MAVKALNNTGLLFTDRRDFYLAPGTVKELWPDVTPFLTMLYNRGSKPTQDPDFKMFEHRSGFIEQKITIGAATAAWASNGDPGDTCTHTVTTATGLHSAVDNSFLGLQLHVFDASGATFKGVVLITAVSAGAFTSGTMTVTALGNPGDTSNDRCSTFVATDIAYVIGNAREEGTVAPEPFSDELSVVWNSTQIFKTPVQVTGTLYEAALRGYSSELARLRMEKMKEHKIQMERAFLFGVRKGWTNMGGADTFGDTHVKGSGGLNIRTTGGMIPLIQKFGSATGDSKNIFAINPATYKYSNFVDDMEKVGQYVSLAGRKVGFCGQQMISYFAKVDTNLVSKSNGNVQLGPAYAGAYGYEIRELRTPHGIIDLVWAPILRGPWAKYMVIIDPGNVEHVQYRAGKYMTNIKTDDAYDGIKDLYQNDEGLGVQMIESHSLWYLTA